VTKKDLIKNQLVKGAGCFTKNTKILTPNGYKNIQDIKIGDEVFCFDKNLNLKTSKVTQTFIHPKEKVLNIYLNKDKITTTPNHPFLNSKYEFQEIGKFKVGDYVIDKNKNKLRIDKIKFLKILKDVYNFTVDVHNTYIVSDRNIFVHNKGGGGSPPPPPPPPDPHTPVEAPEGIKIDGSKKLSRTETEVVDLISEGPIEGLVDGIYTNFGNIGEVGWTRSVKRNYAGGPLRSIYWNQTPLIDENGNYNYSQINFRASNGDQTTAQNLSSPVGGGGLPFASRTITINEPLRYSPPNSSDFIKNYSLKSKFVNKIIVSIKVEQLYDQQNDPMLDRASYGPYKQSTTLGDIRDRTIRYNFKIRKILKLPDGTQQSTVVINQDQNSEGKITSGFIHRFEFDISSAYNPDVEYDSLVGWEVEIKRTSQESTVINLRDMCSIHAITEVFAENFIYPKVGIFRSLFTTEYFSQVPQRAYDVKLLKVKVPSNYDPITKRYAGDWDGTFKSNLEWTDNPAWCYYDLLTNTRYGLGRYIKPNNVDKWQIYEIAKYCDTIVSDGYGGKEPRFTCNAIINDFSDAYTLVNDFASVFRGLSYYANGLVYVTADMPKDPITLFTNSNVENGDFIYSSSSKKVRNTVAVIRYNDVNNFYKPVVEYVEDPEGIRKYGIRKLEITAFGCTSRGQANRLGKWALVSEQIETETVNFTVGLDSLYLTPGDVIKIQDKNRTIERLGGRVLSIGVSGGSHHFVLDQPYSDLVEYLSTINEPNYRFSILTPTSKVTGNRYSDYINEYQKSEIQTGAFNINTISIASGYHPDPARKLVKLSCNKTFDTSNYTLSTGTIWTIERVGNANSWFIVPETEFYRIISVTENEDGKYSVNAMEYNPSKYGAIESGLSLIEAPQPELPSILPPGFPSTFTLSQSANLLAINGAIGAQSQPSNTHSASYWRVYMKKGSNFVSADLEEAFLNDQGDEILAPKADFIVSTLDVLNPTTNFTTTIDENNQTYYFRVYGINTRGHISNGFAAANILYYNEDLVDFANFITLDEFEYSTENDNQKSVSGWNPALDGTGNVFTADNLNLKFKIKNRFPQIIDYAGKDLTFRFDFITGTAFNTSNIFSSIITGIPSPTTDITYSISTNIAGGTSGFAIFSGIALTGFWLAVDAKTGTGNPPGSKWTSQTSLAANRFTRESGYLKGYFINPIPDINMNPNTAVDPYTVKIYIDSDNNAVVNADGYSDAYKDIANFIFFFHQSNSGILNSSSINSYLQTAKSNVGISWIDQLESAGIQTRGAFGVGYDMWANAEPFINYTSSGPIQNGYLRAIPIDNFQNLIIEASEYWRNYTKGAEGGDAFKHPNGNRYTLDAVLNNRKFLDQLIILNNSITGTAGKMDGNLADLFTRQEALAMSGHILSKVVLLSGDQDISGVKNFYSRPTVNGSGVLLQGEVVGGGGSLTVRDEGVNVGSSNIMNFVGAGVTASLAGGVINVNIPGGGGGSVDNPVYTTGAQNITGLKTFISGLISSGGITGTNLVYNTGDQTISGIKNFISIRASGITGTNIVASGFISSGGVTGNNLVYNTGNQIIDGVKTFNYILSAPNLVYNVSGQTIQGIKYFSDGILANNIVYNTGNQVVSGVKQFISRPTFSGTGFLLSGENLGPNLLLSNILQKTGIQNLDGILNISSGLVVNQGITGINLVYNTGNQTVSGIKEFSSRPTVNGTGVLLSGESLPGVTPDKIVYTTGNQIIAGNKTFTSNIISPNLVYTTGDQTINGNKSFNGNVTASNLVYTGDNQNIDGIKNFLKRPTVNGSGIVLGDESFLVYASGGNQNITGTKNFISRPNVNGSGVALQGEVLTLPSGVLFTTGDQTITGVKDFLSRPTYNGIQFMLDGELAVNVNTGDFVYKQGNEVISGIKTFLSGISAPNIVYNTGSQTISGVKTFRNNIFAANLIYTTGDQSISGIKTFNQKPNVNGTGILLSGDVPSLPDTVLFLTGNQNVSGIKNFYERIRVNGSGVVLSGEPIINYQIILASGENVVYTTGDQIITGNKIFTTGSTTFSGQDLNIINTTINLNNIGGMSFSGTTIELINTALSMSGGSFTSLPGTTLNIPNVVYTTGTQTIAGNKTFNLKTNFPQGINATNVVYNTGNENIGGFKNFYDRPTVNGLNVLLEGELYPEISPEDIVYITGNQIINGTKNFIANIVAPNIIYNTGSQNIDGEKNFYIRPTVNGTGVMLNGELFPGLTLDEIVRNTPNQNITGIKTFINGISSPNMVYNTGNQTIGGNKTFSLRANFSQGINAPNVVYNTGNQTIDGIKLFTSRPTVNSSGFVLQGELFPDIDQNKIVFTSGDQNITGIKNIVSGQFLAPNLVYNTGAQIISGVKSFRDRPNVNGTGILLAGDVYPTLNLEEIVYTTGDQVINGFKYFSIRPEVKIDENNESRVALVDEVVNITGSQNVSGYKNFLISPTVNGTGILISGQDLSYRPTVNGSGVLLLGEGVPSPVDIKYQNQNLGNAASINFSGNGVDVYLDGGIANVIVSGAENTVRTTGNQTINGIKTFINGVISNVGITGINLVYNSGAQTINGIKTFNNGIISNLGITGNNLVYNTGNQTINGLKTFANGLISNAGITGTNLVYNTGDQNINGIKNFQSRPRYNDSEVFVQGDYLIDILEEGASLGEVNKINFVGNGVTATVVNGVGTVNITAGEGAVDLSNYVTINSVQTISASKTFASGTFNSGLSLNNSKLINASPDIINITSNFTINSGYNSRVIFVNSSSPVIATVGASNPTGFNVTLIQYGSGPIQIIGAAGVTVNSYANKFNSAGQYSAISLVHKASNEYILFGNTA